MIELFIFLMQKEKTTCKEIADRFGYCERTVHRRITALSSVVPIVTIQGRYGGVTIMPEYKKEFIKKLKKDVIL